MKIDTKYWKIYRTDAEGKVIQPPLAEADTPEELWKLHPRRLDYDYAIYYKRQRGQRQRHCDPKSEDAVHY